MLKRFEETGTIRRKEGSGRSRKFTLEVKAVVDAQMRVTDEMRVVHLYILLQKRG